MPLTTSVPNHSQPVILFDGVCNLCSGAIQFIIRRDSRGRFRFASLQSAAGQMLMLQHKLSPQQLDTIILFEGDRCYTRSDAVLQIVKRLGGLWPLLYAGIALPRPLRDAFYRWVARNRYRWFGRRDQCMLPAPELRRRFLDEE